MSAPARFTRAQLESFHGGKVDDLVGPGLRLLFVGINPGVLGGERTFDDLKFHQLLEGLNIALIIRNVGVAGMNSTIPPAM